jgi:hypothetical protein
MHRPFVTAVPGVMVIPAVVLRRVEEEARQAS